MQERPTSSFFRRGTTILEKYGLSTIEQLIQERPTKSFLSTVTTILEKYGLPLMQERPTGSFFSRVTDGNLGEVWPPYNTTTDAGASNK